VRKTFIKMILNVPVKPFETRRKGVSGVVCALLVRKISVPDSSIS
jgi:hypothetical protein